MGLISGILNFCKRNGGWILTGLSAAGFITTTVLVAQEAPRAENALYEADHEKWSKWERSMMPKNGEYENDDDLYQKYCNNMKNEPYEGLTIFEKIDAVVPIYLPAILVGGTTLLCMFGAQIFNVKQQAALLAAYGLLGKEFAEYRKAVKEEVGEDKEREIYISSQKKIKELQDKIKELEKGSSELYSFASLPGVIFESTPEFMNKVFEHMLWIELQEGGFSLMDLYEHTCLPEELYKNEEAAKYGYLMYENEVTYGNPAVSFEITDVQRYDGKTVHIIGTYDPPYELDRDYGGADSSLNHLYKGYNMERACSLAIASLDIGVEKFLQVEPEIVHVK